MKVFFPHRNAPHRVQYTCYKWDKNLSPGFIAVKFKKKPYLKFNSCHMQDKKKERKKENCSREDQLLLILRPERNFSRESS